MVTQPNANILPGVLRQRRATCLSGDDEPPPPSVTLTVKLNPFFLSGLLCTETSRADLSLCASEDLEGKKPG